MSGTDTIIVTEEPTNLLHTTSRKSCKSIIYLTIVHGKNSEYCSSSSLHHCLMPVICADFRKQSRKYGLSSACGKIVGSHSARQKMQESKIRQDWYEHMIPPSRMHDLLVTNRVITLTWIRTLYLYIDSYSLTLASKGAPGMECTQGRLVSSAVRSYPGYPVTGSDWACQYMEMSCLLGRSLDYISQLHKSSCESWKNINWPWVRYFIAGTPLLAPPTLLYKTWNMSR